MRPFTAFKYFLENKKKGLMTFVVIILTVCAVSLITGLIRSIFDTVNEVDFRMFEDISFISPVDALSGLPQKDVDALRNDADVKELLPVDDMEFTLFNLAVGGNTTVPVIFASAKDEQKYLDVTGDRLKQGRLPESGEKEITVHWKILNNKGWKLGGNVGSDVNDNEMLKGKYKIVGILDGPAVTAVGGTSKQMEQYRKLGISKSGEAAAYAIVPQSGKREAVNHLLSGFNKKEVTVDSYDSMKKQIDDVLSGMSTMLTLIIVIVVFILSISIGALMYLIYTQRSQEFGILTAMGYRRSFIRNLIVKEIFSLNLISWICGILLSAGLIALLNRLIYTPKGTPLTIFSSSSVAYTLIIPLMVAVFSLLPILLKVRRQDAITVIERRD